MHTHGHDNVHEQNHAGDHGHHHDHGHEHLHGHAQDVSDKEVLALLQYMLGHNRHRAEELKYLAANLPREKAELIYAAVEDFGRGNEKIAQVLSGLKGE